jgi:6-phosphofructokinase 1
MKKEIKKIAVFTSGGDAPGMNACIRAVVKTGIHYKKQVVGVLMGYDGLINDNFKSLNEQSVGDIIHRGGTILKTARCLEFKTPEGMEKAYNNVLKNNIDAIVAIGGDGTFMGAEKFSSKYDIPLIGIPGTIDNDMFGTDFTIGFDTATNTTVEAIDKIKDTADSHNRLFFIEVMGRDSGLIALYSGLGGGSEAILLPERETNIDTLVKALQKSAKKNSRSSCIIIVAEGEPGGGALKIAEMVKERFDFYDTKVTILGHLQRGGSPSCFDRVLASRLGTAAVEALLDGKSRKMVGLINNKVILTDLSLAVKHDFQLDEDMVHLSNILSI